MALIETAAVMSSAEQEERASRWAYRSVQTVTGAFVAYLPLRNVRFSRILNGAGAFSAELALPSVDRWADVVTSGGEMVTEGGELVTVGSAAARGHALLRAYLDATDPLSRCIYIERDGVVVDAYWLVARSYDADAQTVQISGAQMWALLRQRRIRWAARFVQQDQLAIARSLVTRTQQQTGGDLGIQVGSETSGRLRDREWQPWDEKPVGEAIEQMAEVIDGFDFRLDVLRQGDTYERRLRLFYPRAGRDAASTGHVWTLGANLLRLDWPENGERTVNSVVALGDGEGPAKKRVTVTDTSVLAEGYPLLEDSIIHSTVQEVSTLDGHARAHLANFARPLVRPRALVLADQAPTLGAYVPGDFARIRIPPHREPYWPQGLDTYARIVEIHGQVPDDGDPEQVELVFEEVAA